MKYNSDEQKIRYNREIVKKITKDHKYFSDPPFYARLLYEICDITEDEKFPKEKIFDENYIIEFDNKHILKNYDTSKLHGYVYVAITVYKQASEKETFPYMSAKEIRNLKKEEDECNFKSFEKKIACIWEKYDIQEELVKNGFACIYIQEDSPLILSDKKTDKKLRKIVKKRRISKSKSAGKNEFKLDIILKEKIGKMMSDKIFDYLGISDKRLLWKFCKKTNYEYTMWMRIYYSPSGTINRCQYILEFYVDEPSHRDCYYNPVRNDLIIMCKQ